MAHLTVNIGNNAGNKSASRALTTTLAQGNVNYYEVAFKDPGYDGSANTKIYRYCWDANNTSTKKIAVPRSTTPTTYTGPTKAVLFAGYIDGNGIKTLLAVGEITATSDDGITDNHQNSTEITVNTKSVTFTLAALENDVNSNKVAPNASTFQVLGPTAYATPTKGIEEIPGPNGETFPVFAVPSHGTQNDVDSSTDTPSVATNILVEYKVDCANFAGVKINATNWVSSLPYEDYFGVEGVKVGITPKPSPVRGAQVPSSFKFLIDVENDNNNDPITKDGLSMIIIDVPVIAIEIDATDMGDAEAGGTWYIRGGLSNDEVDEGVSVQSDPTNKPTMLGSLGGAVLLLLGDYDLLTLQGLSVKPPSGYPQL
jgi:hypothetical protein